MWYCYILSFYLLRNVSILYAIIGTLVKVELLKGYGKCRKAIITSDLSSYAHRYTKAYLMYEFNSSGKIYNGNSLINDTSKIGDSICIIYFEAIPSINRPITYFDEGEIKCNCK